MKDNKTKPLFTQDIKSADIAQSNIRCMGCMEEFSAEFEICPHCGYAVGSKPKSPYFLKPGMNLSDRYMLGKVIGQGGFGITYIGWDKNENRKVAVKEFFPNALSTRTEGETLVSCYNEKAESYFKEGVKKMMDESERLSRFSFHPNIVNVCDSFEENNTAYIVMEYLDGKSLKEYAEENGGRLAPEEAVKLMMPVLDALGTMHKENMIHRDIAPDNIFICTDGTIKLLDFGSARIAVQDAEKSLSVMVKPGYAPKEQYASRSKQGPWTDVYSVCATLYRLITGEAPVESIERDTTPLKTFASFDITGYDTLENIIVKGLEPDYEKRLRNAEALRNVITKTVLTNESRPVAVSVTPEPVKNEPQPQKEPEIKKKKKPIGGKFVAVVACLVLVVAAGALGLYFLGGQGTPEPKGSVRVSGDLTDTINWTLYKNGCLLIEGSGDMPDFEGDYDADAITSPWFSESEHIKSVVIDDGITRIGDGAFRSCTSLESISIPDGVTSIGEGAFSDCDNLKDVYYGGTEQQRNEINIEAGNEVLFNAHIHFNFSALETSSKTTVSSETEINTEAETEMNTEAETEINTEVESTQEIESTQETRRLILYRGRMNSDISWTFYDDGLLSFEGSGDMPFCRADELAGVDFSNQIKTVIIGYGITNVGIMFEGCTNITSVTIPDSVTVIGNGAFKDCEGLESITIPYGVTSIGDYAFAGCTKLRSVTIPDSVTYIDVYAFCACYNLTNVTISKNVTKISEGVFWDCPSLNNVSIPDGVTEIHSHAFSDCPSLTKITIPDSVIEIRYSAFEDCVNLSTVSFKYTGTGRQWSDIIIGEYNEPLLNADVEYVAELAAGA